MSEVTLATKYAAENYPIALKNLAKRYQRNDDGEAIHFSELGFGDISDQQAKVALRFFGNVGLIENTKHANYVPPESVVTWQRKMGDRAEEAKEDVRQSLLDYDVFNETTFVLEEGEAEIDVLAEQVGGMVGIDEDELSEMKKTIEIFSELGFINIDEENIVSLPDSSGEGVFDTSESEKGIPDESEGDGPTDETLKVSGDTEDLTAIEQEVDQISSNGDSSENATQNSTSRALTTDVDISIDATEMEAEDLKNKLEIIEDTIGYDGD